MRAQLFISVICLCNIVYSQTDAEKAKYKELTAVLTDISNLSSRNFPFADKKILVNDKYIKDIKEDIFDVTLEYSGGFPNYTISSSAKLSDAKFKASKIKGKHKGLFGQTITITSGVKDLELANVESLDAKSVTLDKEIEYGTGTSTVFKITLDKDNPSGYSYVRVKFKTPVTMYFLVYDDFYKAKEDKKTYGTFQTKTLYYIIRDEEVDTFIKGFTAAQKYQETRKDLKEIK